MQFFIRIVAALTILAAIVFGARVTSPDLTHNPASFEDQPFVMALAPVREATTLAQYTSETGEVVTLLVTDYDGQTVSGIDLFSLGAPRDENPFVVLASVDLNSLELPASGIFETVKVPVQDLMPSGPSGERHIGIGTNFPEHAEESSSDGVFNFPKFGAATPARTEVRAPEGSLLDYEVELCLRFDRPIGSLEDFDAAVKGLFLCADFTDRIALVQLADADNLDSGYGFSDAKSGEGYFPTGLLLVIPNDLAAFVANTRMTTTLNNEPRQDARGHEMTLDFRQLTQKVLADMSAERFYYQGDFYRLAPDSCIDADMTLMSGTSEGVIFTAPARHDYIDIILGYLMQGGHLGATDLDTFGKQRFIENELAGGHFLQPGDTVTYSASGLGDIVVAVTD